MASIALPLSDRTCPIAVIVARSQRKAMLSLFFAKCDGLLIIDPDALGRKYRANTDRTKAFICDLIPASGVTKLVCGFIPKPDRDKLFASGVDIRIGCCARPDEALVRGFNALPVA